MTKRSKRKKSHASQKKIKSIVILNAGIILAFFGILFMSGNLPFIGFIDKEGRSFSVQGGENRPVLSPALFRGKALAAYSAAKRYPEVLDQLYCYCSCDNPPFNHVSLLSCFVDRHGETWDLCQEEALRAAQLYSSGKSIEEIKAAVDREFVR